MTWLRIEDNMLDHPKWRRAISLGGDEALVVWLRLLSWCSRNLTDGHVPADMVSEVARVRYGVTRSRAIQALVTAGLLTCETDLSVTLVDYLQRNPSASQVRESRLRKTEAQRNRRNARADAVPQPRSEAGACSVPIPSHPIPSQSQRERDPERAREPDPPSSPTVTEIRPLRPSRREQEPALTEPATHTRIPPGWSVPEPLYGEAIAAGVTRAGLDDAVRYWRGRKLGGEWFTIEDFFRAKFASIRSSEERARFSTHQRAGPGGMAAKQHNPGISGFESFQKDDI